MNAIIQDECLRNLYYAQEAMKDWIPLSEYEMIFEASENPETARKVAQNEETETKTVGFVRKAIDAVIQMIKKLYEAVKDLIDRCTMSGAEREAFNQFKETMAQDPALKNKKITVQDFRKINETYDSLINEIDQNIRSVKANADHPIDGLVEKVTGFLKGTVTSSATIVAADLALKIADSNMELAKVLKVALKEESTIMETLSKSLGKRRAEKFRKEIDAAAKNTMLHRLKVRLFRKRYDNIHEVIQGTIRAFTHAGFATKAEVKEKMRDLKQDRKDGKISKDQYKSDMRDLKNAKKDAKKEIHNSLKLDKQILDNEYTGTIVKTTAKAAVRGAVDAGKDAIGNAVDTAIKDKITDRDRKKRDAKGEYKPAHKFFGKS